LADVIIHPVSRIDCLPFIMDIHYAHRMPSVSYRFGLFRNNTLEGIVTYGTPSSAPLRSGICGPEFSASVLELNRLCLRNNIKNDASRLVAASLKMLPKDKIIISFADTDQCHVGTVYQACNFVYCGLSAKRTDWKIRGMEHLHGQTIADEFRGKCNRSELMRQKYGSDFYLKDRPRKHRYVYFVGSRKFKKKAFAALRYDPESYPK
jgi:hypothetical protein